MKLLYTLLLIGAVSALPTNESECYGDSDCPAYNYCFHSPFFPNQCIAPEYDALNCEAKNNQGVSFPDHEICKVKETQVTDSFILNEFTVSRCFKINENGRQEYRCGNAYFNACTPSFDYNSVKVKDQDCPEHFRCQKFNFKDGPKNVCFPVKYATDAGTSESCQTSLDCGYSVLQSKWAECIQNKCVNSIQ